MGRQIDLPLRDGGGRTLVFGGVGVVMRLLVQVSIGGQRLNEENEEDQQGAERRLGARE